MAGKNPLNKTKLIFLDSLMEIVRYRMDLEKVEKNLKDSGLVNRAAMIEGEIAGVNRVLDLLKLRTDVIMVSKMIEDGKIDED